MYLRPDSTLFKTTMGCLEESKVEGEEKEVSAAESASEASEQASKRVSEWPSTSVSIPGSSKPPWVLGKGARKKKQRAREVDKERWTQILVTEQGGIRGENQSPAVWVGVGMNRKNQNQETNKPN